MPFGLLNFRLAIASINPLGEEMVPGSAAWMVSSTILAAILPTVRNDSSFFFGFAVKKIA